MSEYTIVILLFDCVGLCCNTIQSIALALKEYVHFWHLCPQISCRRDMLVGDPRAVTCCLA